MRHQATSFYTGDGAGWNSSTRKVWRDSPWDSSWQVDIVGRGSWNERSASGQCANRNGGGFGEKGNQASPDDALWDNWKPTYQKSTRCTGSRRHVDGRRVTADEIASAPKNLQKSILGEALHPLVEAIVEDHQRGLVDKITGMLLEMDNSEVLLFLDEGAGHQMLREQVQEAVRLLQEQAIKESIDDEVPLDSRLNSDSVVPALGAQGSCDGQCAVLSTGAIGDLDGAESVSQGLTLPCAVLAQATLEGRRCVDSRHWRIPYGWYALHAGSRPVPKESEEALRQTWPEAPSVEAMLTNVVGGLIYIEDKTLRPIDITGDPWTTGPICHVVSKTITLPRPVISSGASGLWPLPAAVVEDILEQLPGLRVTYLDVAHLMQPQPPKGGKQAEAVNEHGLIVCEPT